MNTGNRNVVVVIWVVFTFLGSVIGLFLGSMAGEHFGFSLGSSIESFLQKIMASFPMDYLPGMAAGFIYGAVSGFFPGIAQWFAVLRGQYKNSVSWIFLNMFGMAITFSLNSGVYAFLNSFMNNALLLSLIYMFINGLITGIMIGLFQWIFFRRKHPRSYWWLVLMLEDQSYLLVEFAFVVIDSIGFALFTGLALYLTFPQPVPESEGIITI
jgi:hypothetical protein